MITTHTKKLCVAHRRMKYQQRTNCDKKSNIKSSKQQNHNNSFSQVSATFLSHSTPFTVFILCIVQNESKAFTHPHPKPVNKQIGRKAECFVEYIQRVRRKNHTNAQMTTPNNIDMLYPQLSNTNTLCAFTVVVAETRACIFVKCDNVCVCV